MKPARNFLRRSKIECLENRALMAAGITANLSDGMLIISGSEQADNIYVRQINNTLRVDGVAESFDAGTVTAVMVDARGGDDCVRLDIDGQTVTKTSLIDAGGGNDHVRGGRGDDTVYLGAGDDIAVTHAGSDTVYGGSGNDRVWTGEGNDKTSGDSGNDEIVLGAGDDFAAGGSGHDKIWGEAGRDVLDGGSGDDMLAGAAGNDELFGGSGSDSLYGDGGSNRLDAAGAARATMSSINLDDLRRATDAAIERWSEAGTSALSLAKMRNVEFRVADLPDTFLGLSVRRGPGSAAVWVDTDAAGSGWFVDASPADNAEFAKRVADNIHATAHDSALAGRSDLLTVVAHELGHSIGVAHTTHLSTMTDSLPTGVRILPDQTLVAAAAEVATQPTFGAMHSFRDTVTSPFAQQLSQNGLAPSVANYFGQYLDNVQSQVGNSLLTPRNVAANASTTVAPLGNTGLVQRPTQHSQWLNPDATVSQALAIAQLLGAQSGANYINSMLSADARRDFITSHGYGEIANLTASSAHGQRAVNDPSISQISGQWVHNATTDYITDRYGIGGVHGMNLQGIANDFGVNSGHLNQLLALPGMQPAGTIVSPFIQSMGLPIGYNPVDRYTYNGSQPYSPWYGGSSVASMPVNNYGYSTTVTPQTYGLPYSSSGVFTPTASTFNYGNVYANPWNY
jgi:hypothetical protein